METKQCLQCSKTFRIDEEDFAFYAKMDVPAPTLCPDCRQQRRLAHRNERFYYQRKCDLTGKPLVTVYSPDGPIKRVYNNRDWFSDKWTALDYGRDFDFSRPFFEQFAEMMYEVPHPNLWLLEAENADYNHCCLKIKDSYMNSGTDFTENAFYCNLVIKSQSIADSMASEKCELAIECIDCENMYNSAFNQQCRNCVDTYLSYDCSGGKYLFGCSGLRNKEYHIFNKPVTKEQWDERVPKMLSSHSELQKAMAQAYEVSLKTPRLFNAIYGSEDCTGNYIWNSTNCKNSFDVRESQDVKYVTYVPLDAKDGMDSYAMGIGELFYEANFGPVGYNNKFSMWIEHGPNNSAYNVYAVQGCNNLFGTVGLKKEEYVIFNKKYTVKEYEELRDKITAHMKETGEWGEFFPASMSAFGYNETIAQEYFPLEKNDVERYGWNWQDNTGGTYGQETLDKIDDNIIDVDDEIVKEMVACEDCGRNYRFIKPEIDLYKQMGVALPRKCFMCRHLNRVKKRSSRTLWKRQCMCTQPSHEQHSRMGTADRCAEEFETTYHPDRKELVYCQQCYQKEIY